MYTVFQKEIASFFGSLIGYLVMAVFLTGVGLFFWAFEGNVLEALYATLDPLFSYGPYFLLFLVPAITMRAFAEEAKTGTLELLFTKPLTSWQVIGGKYLAALFLIVFSLLPTIVYAITIWVLGSPQGNVDVGASIGSYIGLIAIGGIFAGIGLFTSALTDNQIVAFILGVFLCFICFVGFEYLSGIKVITGFTAILVKLGIMEHYRSISRGVIDSRDMIYFLSFIAISLLATRLVLRR
ncbi:MAG: gliding motility-associated ABC transporter permease subunit GldF [Bacteroidia bacterium]